MFNRPSRIVSSGVGRSGNDGDWRRWSRGGRSGPGSITQGRLASRSFHEYRKPLATDVIGGQFAVAQDFAEEAGAEGFVAVDGDDGRSAVGLAENVVAAADTDDGKTVAFETTDHVTAR